MSDGQVQIVSAVLGAVLLTAMGLCGIADIWLGYRYGWPATISATIQRWSVAWPILPLSVGLLMGHLFWPTSTVVERRPQ